MSELSDAVNKVALALAKEAADESTTLERKLEIFKLLSHHSVNMEKVKGKKSAQVDEPGAGTTMNGLRNRVAEGSSAPPDPSSAAPIEDEDDDKTGGGPD